MTMLRVKYSTIQSPPCRDFHQLGTGNTGLSAGGNKSSPEVQRCLPGFSQIIDMSITIGDDDLTPFEPTDEIDLNGPGRHHTFVTGISDLLLL